MSEIETGENGPVESAPEAPIPEFNIDAAMDGIAARIEEREPDRGEDGKFQPKVVAQGAPEAPEVPGNPGTAPPDPAPPVIEAPQSLPADVKAKWSTLPPEVQTYWASREGEIHKKLTTDGERLKNLEAYDDALKEASQFIEQNRIPRAEYIRRLTAADQALRTNGPAALAEIARMYGINPGAAPQPGLAPDPHINALHQELAQLKSSLADREKAEQSSKLEAEQRRVETFKKDKPHFDEVEPLMVKLYEPGMELDKLYTMAVKAHPEVSLKIEAEAKADADKKAAAEAKEKAAKDAKAAPFARRPGAQPTSAAKGSWEDTMGRVAKEIAARPN